MIKIKIASIKEKRDALKIAKELPEWFNDVGIKNLKTDLKHNNVIIAVEKKNILGFLCYTTCCGKIQLIWMGIRKENQRIGVGSKLLSWLEGTAKNLGCYAIEVETLPDEEDYEPYKQTRNFYYKNGFKRIEYRKARIKGWDDQILLEKRIS